LTDGLHHALVPTGNVPCLTIVDRLRTEKGDILKILAVRPPSSTEETGLARMPRQVAANPPPSPAAQTAFLSRLVELSYDVPPPDKIVAATEMRTFGGLVLAWQIYPGVRWEVSDDLSHHAKRYSDGAVHMVGHEMETWEDWHKSLSRSLATQYLEAREERLLMIVPTPMFALLAATADAAANGIEVTGPIYREWVEKLEKDGVSSLYFWMGVGRQLKASGPVEYARG